MLTLTCSPHEIIRRLTTEMVTSKLNCTHDQANEIISYAKAVDLAHSDYVWAATTNGVPRSVVESLHHTFQSKLDSCDPSAYDTHPITYLIDAGRGPYDTGYSAMTGLGRMAYNVPASAYNFATNIPTSIYNAGRGAYDTVASYYNTPARPPFDINTNNTALPTTNVSSFGDQKAVDDATAANTAAVRGQSSASRLAQLRGVPSTVGSMLWNGVVGSAQTVGTAIGNAASQAASYAASYVPSMGYGHQVSVPPGLTISPSLPFIPKTAHGGLNGGGF